MKILDQKEQLTRIAGKDKYLLYLSFCPTDDMDADMTGIYSAVPFLDRYQRIELILQGTLLIEFDTNTDLEHHYQQVVGDDGPGPLNSYDGPCRVFASTFYKGEFHTENT